MSLALNGTNGVTYNDGTQQSSAPVGRNRIINGDMRIDQRNAGASVTPANVAYTLDRWGTFISPLGKYTVQQNAGSVTPPVGFTNYLGVTSTSAYSITSGDYFAINQSIEGYNIADLAWGTADAKTVTLSFWVRSSLTGTFGGSLRNNGATRSYPFSYTISVANTWEKKTITIAGDTTGTWLTTNGKGIELNFGLGIGSTSSGTAGSWAGTNYLSATGATSIVGTSGATFYITGVQLEVGDTATDFENLQYGQQLALCQRYYQVIEAGVNAYSSTGITGFPFTTSMRTTPTMTFSWASVANRVYRIDTGGTSDLTVASTVFSTNSFVSLFAPSPGGWASAAGVGFRSTFVFNAEL
jgi:hypothetical protein